MSSETQTGEHYHNELIQLLLAGRAPLWGELCVEFIRYH